MLRFALLAATDLAAAIVALLAIQALRYSLFPGTGTGAMVQWRDTILCTVLVLVMAVRLYHAGRYSLRMGARVQATYLHRYCAIAFLVHGTLILLLGFHEGYMLAVWVLLPPLAGMFRRMAWAAFRQTGVLSSRTLLAGAPQAVAVVRGMLGDGTASGLEVVATCGTVVPPGGAPARAWRALLARHGAEMVVVAVQGHAHEQPMLRSLQQAGVPAAKMIALDGAGRPVRTRDLGTRDLGTRDLGTRDLGSRDLGSRVRGRVGLHPAEHALKSLVDFVSAVVLLVVLFPALLLLALVVKSDGGPILFKHERVGLRGRMFHCLKFRTMFPDGDKLLHDLLERDPAARQEWNETQKLRRDPRVTPVGRLLRATSMDELPQLLNVLQGEMSLVGPRPVVPVELPRYGADIAYYLAATPGLTGLWQVSGRSDTSYERRVQLDIAYVRDWSFWTDIRILLQTFPVVLLRRGAV